jgi:hypothetical protein
MAGNGAGDIAEMRAVAAEVERRKKAKSADSLSTLADAHVAAGKVDRIATGALWAGLAGSIAAMLAMSS